MKRVVLMALISLAGIRAFATCTPVWTNNYTVVAADSPCIVDGSQRFFNLEEDKRLTVSPGATLIINGDLDIWDNVEVFGTLTVSGTISVAAEANLLIREGATVNAGNFQNGGLFPGKTTVLGTLNVQNNLANRMTGTLTGKGTINGNVLNDGVVTYAGVLSGSCAGNCEGGLAEHAIAFVGDVGSEVCQLHWSAAKGTVGRGFYVEKMTRESDEFESVGFVPVDESGEGDRHSYTFTDNEFSGDAYYRLRLAKGDAIGDFGQAIFISRLAKHQVSEAAAFGHSTATAGNNKQEK